MAEDFDDRVHLSIAQHESNNYSIHSQQTLNQNGNPENQSMNFAFNWNEFINKSLPLLVGAFVFIVIFNQFSKIIESLALLDSWAIAVVLIAAIFLIILMLVILSRLFNKGKRYSKDADASYMVGN